MAYHSIVNQSTMAFDENRNRVYRAALEEVISDSSVVLDLGAGLGTLGLMAAKLGAKHVYLVEPQPLIRTVRNVVRQNKLEHRVSCIHSRIEDLLLDEKVDVIISCFTGNFLLSEDLLPKLFLARDSFLKEDGHLLPGAGRMIMVPVHCPKVYQSNIGYLRQPHWELDYSFYLQRAANTVQKQRNLGHKNYLDMPKVLQSLDFNSAETAECDTTIEFNANRSADCHGFLGWFEISLASHALSCSPDAPNVHWSPLWFPTHPPIAMEEGQTLSISVRKQSGKNWVWSFESDTVKQSHSSFLGEIGEMATSFGGKSLNIDGQATLFALAQLRQGVEEENISDGLVRRWNNHFDAQAATQFIRQLSAQYLR